MSLVQTRPTKIDFAKLRKEIRVCSVCGAKGKTRPYIGIGRRWRLCERCYNFRKNDMIMYPVRADSMRKRHRKYIFGRLFEK